MLVLIFSFLTLAIISGVLGFTGIAVAAAGIAKILFYIFFTLLLISIVISTFSKRKP